MRKVAELLASRPSKNHFVVTADTPLLDAIKLLAFRNLGTLMVMEGSTLVGTFSHAHCTLRVALEGFDFSTMKVCDAMTKDIAYATPDTSLAECMTMMTGYVIGVMPVLQRGKLVGIVEMREVTNAALTHSQAKNFTTVRRQGAHVTCDRVSQH